jgi:hypothetical protein
VLLDLVLNFVDFYARLVNQNSPPMTLNMLTLAVVDVDDSVPIAQSLGDAADEALGALGCGVDTNQVEGTFRSRHDDGKLRIIRKTRPSWEFCSFYSPG